MSNDYQGFEFRYQRQPEARHLLADVAQRLEKGLSPYEGVIPDTYTIASLFAEWLPAGRFHCLQQSDKRYPSCGGPHDCHQRCSAEYWRSHSHHVAEMMCQLARVLGQDERLWYVTGLLHDIDYLKYPHHEDTVCSRDAHPLSISYHLNDIGAPPAMVLAILAHAPHMGLKPTSLLSLALVACDEHSTMSGAGWQPDYPKDIAQPLKKCLSPGPSKIQGYVRPDMMARATYALRGLSLELERVSLRVGESIDWAALKELNSEK